MDGDHCTIPDFYADTSVFITGATGLSAHIIILLLYCSYHSCKLKQEPNSIRIFYEDIFTGFKFTPATFEFIF